MFQVSIFLENYYQIERFGSQLGENFGYTVCAEDFNKDGLSDLAVGAPTHSLTDDNDVGCVYIYTSLSVRPIYHKNTRCVSVMELVHFLSVDWFTIYCILHVVRYMSEKNVSIFENMSN